MNAYLEMYAPIQFPIQWQTESVVSNNERYQHLSDLIKHIPNFEITALDWPIGYGSLDYDHLPLLYQPVAIIKLAKLNHETFNSVEIFPFDKGICVVKIQLNHSISLQNSVDLDLAEKASSLINEEIQPKLDQCHKILKNTMKRQNDSSLDPSEIFKNKTFWIARSLIHGQEVSPQLRQQWLPSADISNDTLILGSGNSILLDQKNVSDFTRVMVTAQFHSAYLWQTEQEFNHALNAVAPKQLGKINQKQLNSKINDYQNFNDQIEYSLAQFSSVLSGTQGLRKPMLRAFIESWQFQQQTQRIQTLMSLLQTRLQRYRERQKRKYDKRIQAILGMIGMLSVLELISELSKLSQESDHQNTTGILDIFMLISPEILLNGAIFLVVLFTILIYRNHD
jgi:hypothetical protein